MEKLGVMLFGHNLQDIQYPYLPALASALSLTRTINGSPKSGRVWFAICSCTDETEKRIRESFGPEIDRGELGVVYHAWGDTHSIQVEICNGLLDHIGEQVGYVLKLDADEVLHEESFVNFATDLHRMDMVRALLGNPHYTHLLDNERDFDFIYRAKAVLCRTAAHLRFADNDACALGGAPEYQTRLEIFHYGKWSPGRRREALLKEITFTKLYKDLGFPDPRVVAQLEQGYLDYDRVFENARQHGDVRPWSGTHPLFVQQWVADSLEREKQFQESLKNGQIGPLQTEKWW